jgi:hypothetical protein
MCKVYQLLNGRVFNPRMIKAEILKSNDRGAVWNNAIYALIEHVVQTNTGIWKIAP